MRHRLSWTFLSSHIEHQPAEPEEEARGWYIPAADWSGGGCAGVQECWGKSQEGHHWCCHDGRGAEEGAGHQCSHGAHEEEHGADHQGPAAPSGWSWANRHEGWQEADPEARVQGECCIWLIWVYALFSKDIFSKYSFDVWFMCLHRWGSLKMRLRWNNGRPVILSRGSANMRDASRSSPTR